MHIHIHEWKMSYLKEALSECLQILYQFTLGLKDETG